MNWLMSFFVAVLLVVIVILTWLPDIMPFVATGVWE